MELLNHARATLTLPQTRRLPLQGFHGGVLFVLGHLSDLHATRIRFRIGELPSLVGKRGLGWLSWWGRRRLEYRPEILDLLAADLAVQTPDHVAVTGDLTHLGLRSEIEEAAEQLERLFPAERLSLVPGNHDAYRAPVDLSRWMPFTSGDRRGHGALPCWVRGPVALIGLDSARPTRWPLATGWLGAPQLEALEAQLEELGRRGLFRVLLLHHPPHFGATSSRRALTDAEQLAAVLERRGAELVLHGHVHRTCSAVLPGPGAGIPCVGVRAASARGRRPERRAQYHLYQIEGSAPPYRVRLVVRGLNDNADRFVAIEDRVL